MTSSVEASSCLTQDVSLRTAGYASLNALFTDAHGTLLVAADHLARPTNGFNATVARRELLELCVKVADEYGHEVRHDAR